jgi:hypothetical protein
MSLPAAWTDKIFTKLILVYGRDFSSRWEGMNIADVKADWSHEMTGYENRPKAIVWALQNLPVKPPTVLEFRKIANTLPAEQVPELHYVKAGQDRVTHELAKLAPVRDAPLCGAKDWAHRAIAKDAAGERVTPYTLMSARAALGMVG